jgi:tetratricopeptide (TPR) repeat protein
MPEDSSTPQGSDDLAGLDLSALFDQALRPRCKDWTPPLPADLAGQIPQCEITGLLGRGGMGAVYCARQTALDREVAVKILPPEADPDGSMTERFRREGRILARLSHPNIVTVFDSGTTPDGHLYIVMELASGGDLAKRMYAERLPVEEAVTILLQVGAAVAAAHEQGVIHRDLKPSNVLLMADGTAKVADFGLAVPLQSPETERLTREDATLGTAEYAAPEQYAARKGGPPPDCRSDIYSLGVLACEIFTGALPRGVFDLPSQKSGVLDPAVDAVMLKALQSDPRSRFASAGEFCAALTAAMDRPKQQEKRDREARALLRRRTRLVVAFGSLAVAALAAAAYGWRQQRAAEQHAAEALQQRHKAEELIDFLVSDLQANLRQTGRESLLRALAQQLERYFADQPERTDTDFLRRKANGLRVIALHHLGRGNPDLGFRLAAEVLSLREIIAAREPDNVNSVRARNSALLMLEESRMDNGQAERASFDAVLTASRAAHAQFPNDRSTILHLARTLLFAGYYALGAGHHALAEERFHELEAVSRPVLERVPGDGDFRDYVWNARAALVELREARGELAGALADNEQVIAAFLKMLDEWPDYDTLKLAHVRNLERKALLLLKLERFEEAGTASQQALTVTRDQLANDPAHRTKLDRLTTLLMLHSRIRRALHDDAGALASLEEAREICERVLIVSPWVFTLYKRRAEILTLLAPLRSPENATEATFLRRYTKELLVTTEAAEGEFDYMRRLLEILRTARASISAAEGPATAAAWWAEQVTYVRHFLPGGALSKGALRTDGANWSWIISEMETPQE